MPEISLQFSDTINIMARIVKDESVEAKSEGNDERDSKAAG
jgi:hypothetical protein